MRFSSMWMWFTVPAAALLLAACSQAVPVEVAVVPELPVSSPTPITVVYRSATFQPSPTIFLAPATLTPTPYDDPDYFYGGLVVTLDHAGQTILLKKRQNFLLSLGKDYNWTVTVAPESVISRNMVLTPEPGEQGVYVARGSGTASLRAVGEPVCIFFDPPCMRPSLLFEAQIEIE